MTKIRLFKKTSNRCFLLRHELERASGEQMNKQREAAELRKVLSFPQYFELCMCKLSLIISSQLRLTGLDVFFVLNYWILSKHGPKSLQSWKNYRKPVKRKKINTLWVKFKVCAIGCAKTNFIITISGTKEFIWGNQVFVH